MKGGDTHITNQEINTSTGSLGVSRRQFNRLYINSRAYGEGTPEAIQQGEATYQRFLNVGERHDWVGRNVFRSVVHDGVVAYIAQNGLQDQVEVGLNLSEFGQDNSWLVYLARNKEGRERIVAEDEMIRETESHPIYIQSPAERIRGLWEKGYTFADQIAPDEVAQLYGLWSDVFGWTHDQVEGLRTLIESDKATGKPRSLWLSVIKQGNQIVSAATAERLSLKAKDGDFDVVESTEWIVHPDFRGNHLMPATIAMLSADILYTNTQHALPTPLIYAECNFQSRSDRSGHSAGYRVPERNVHGITIPQILVQNVGVQDGQPVPEGKLRDFTFMYLPMEAIQTYYNDAQLEAIRTIASQ